MENIEIDIQEVRQEGAVITAVGVGGGGSNMINYLAGPKNYGAHESFEVVNDVLARAVNGISGVILHHSPNDINVDFADVKTVMSHKGLALMGIGEATGDNAACEAVRMAIESPLLDNISINGAMGVLVNFEMNGYPFGEIGEAMNMIESIVDNKAYVIFGTRTLADVAKDYVKVTVVATGFEREVVSTEPQPQMCEEQGLEQSRQSLHLARKVSGGDTGLFDKESLEVPTYLRNQKD